MKTRPLAVTAVVGIGALLLAGCSSEETIDEATTPEPVVEDTVEEEAPEEQLVEEDAAEENSAEENPVEEPAEQEPEEPAAPAEDGEHAAPGDTFAIGDTAVVAWETYGTDDIITLNVTVDSVTEGDLDDVLALELGDDTTAAIQGHTPFYVDFSITKGDPSQLELAHRNATTEIGAVDAGGAKILELALLGGGFDTCESNAFGREIDEGEATESCAIFLVPEGREFGSVIWSQMQTAYSEYDGDPLVWQ